jgi:hypothetical protein
MLHRLDLFLEAFTAAMLYNRMANLLLSLVPRVRHEISNDQYTCDFDGGNAVQVNTNDQWVPKSALYQRVVGPRLRVASSFGQLISSGRELLSAINKMENAERELGLQTGEEYDGMRKEVEKLFVLNPVLLRK